MRRSRHRKPLWVALLAIPLLLLVWPTLVGGAPNQTILISRASAPSAEKGNGTSSGEVISADGRFVAFESTSTNLDPDDTDNASDIFIRDTQTNATKLVSRATGASGASADADATRPSISSDGRFVAFESIATNLAPDDNVQRRDVFVRDRQTNQTLLISRAPGAAGAAGDFDSSQAEISADGSAVVFASFASNLVHPTIDGDVNGDVFVRTWRANPPDTIMASRANNGQNSSGTQAFAPTISANGRVVAWAADSTNLSPADTTNDFDVYLRNLDTTTTTLVSRASDNNGNLGPKGNASSNLRGPGGPAISANGRLVVFHSQSTNLDPADTDGNLDVFLRDTQANTTKLVSRAAGATGAKGNSYSINPSISASGRWVVFTSSSTNLSPDGGGSEIEEDSDTFLRDTQGLTTTLVSIDDSAPAGQRGVLGQPLGAAVTPDGRFVVFDTQSDKLDGDFVHDAFRRELVGDGSGTGDRDGDGVPDSQDACPDQPANTANGCPAANPDRDGDGVPDASDQCPDQAAATVSGCPAGSAPADRDSDGVPDASDRCPDNPGTLADGCPAIPPDRDSDGVPDHLDACPGTYSLAADGCPAPQRCFSPWTLYTGENCTLGSGLVVPSRRIFRPPPFGPNWWVPQTPRYVNRYHQYGSVWSFTVVRPIVIRFVIVRVVFLRRGAAGAAATREKKIGSFRYKAKKGKNSFRFIARYKGKPFAPGRYKATATPAKGKDGPAPSVKINFQVKK